MKYLLTWTGPHAFPSPYPLPPPVGDHDANKENIGSDRNVKTHGKRKVLGSKQANRKKRELGNSRERLTSEANKSVIVVRGRLWSKNVFTNARLAGLSRDAAWLEAFV